VDKAGHALTAQGLASACPQLRAPLGPSTRLPTRASGGLGLGVRTAIHQAAPVPGGVQNALQDCVVKLAATFHQSVTYQPTSRYWDFQWSELAIFLGAAAVLSGFCIWWVRRRLS